MAIKLKVLIIKCICVSLAISQSDILSDSTTENTLSPSDPETTLATTNSLTDNNDVNSSILSSIIPTNLATTQPSRDKNISADLISSTTSCEHTNCVRKCCQKGMYRSRKCEPLEDGMEDWVPEIPNFSILYGSPPKPNNKSRCFRHLLSEVELLLNGSVSFKPRNIILSTDYYCFENGISGKNESYVLVGACYEPILHSDFEVHMKLVTKIAVIISCCFLAVLIVTHIFQPDMRKKTHEKIFLSMCITLFCGFFSLLFIRLAIVGTYSHSVCVMLGILVQYFNLCFNFWLNVRCYETFRIIRGTVKAIPMSLLNSSNKRFLKYSIWCWGIPFIISIVTLIMQTLPDGVLEKVRPNIGDGRCWFPENLLILGIYYFGYQLVLHIINICFLGTCFFLLSKTGEINCFTKKKQTNDKIRIYNKKGLNMFWQQFFIFLIYIILLSLDTLTLANSEAAFWLYVDVINTLQGVYLFAIFLISSKNRRKLVINAMKNTSAFAKSLSTSISSRVLTMGNSEFPDSKRGSSSLENVELQESQNVNNKINEGFMPDNTT